MHVSSSEHYLSILEMKHRQRTYYRAVFLSDVHLGFRGCQAKNLLTFLKSIECEYLYLVGDIFDLWAMKDKIWWNQECTSVLRRILKMTKQGTKVIYIIGNHDDVIRHFIPLAFGSEIEVKNEAIHRTVNNTKLLIIHGDCFDFVARWLSMLGSRIYDRLIMLNTIVHKIRVLLGFRRYWSLSANLKKRTKRALGAIKSFEDAVLHHAKKLDCDGAISGHIHTAKLINVDGMIYANCGDWVESLTALVEMDDGQLNLIHWHDLTSEGIEDHEHDAAVMLSNHITKPACNQ